MGYCASLEKFRKIYFIRVRDYIMEGGTLERGKNTNFRDFIHFNDCKHRLLNNEYRGFDIVW